MDDGVTFKRDNYPALTALWGLGFAGAGLLFVTKKFIPSMPTPFINWLTVFTYILGVISIIVLFFDNRKILSITQNGLYLFTGRPFSDDSFFVDWKEIKKAEVANRESMKICLPRQFMYSARINRDTLTIHLNSPLNSKRTEQFNQITSKLLSSDQLMSNDSKTEIWITLQPRDGFGGVLTELSKYVETKKSGNFNGGVNNTTQFFHLINQILLPVGVLILLYLST